MVSFREIRGTFSKLKFRKKEKTDHEWYELRNRDGGFVLATSLSRQAGGRDVSKKLLGKIAKDISLTSNQFRKAIGCPLDHEGYYEILRAKGFPI